MPNKRTRNHRAIEEALLDWIASRERVFTIAGACRRLGNEGHRAWDVGRVVRRSALFATAGIDASLPEGYQETAFRLSAEGVDAWRKRRGQSDSTNRSRRRRRRSRKEGSPLESVEPSPEAAVASLAGFWNVAEHRRQALRCVAGLAGDGWVAAETLYPALRRTFGWSAHITPGMITSACGMLVALGDLDRRKKSGSWEYGLAGAS